MNWLTPIEVLAGESRDIVCTCLDEAGANLDVSGAWVIFEMRPRTAQDPTVTRKNAAAGGGTTEVTMGPGTNAFTVHVIPTNTPTRGSYRYRIRAGWPNATPPIDRIWEGEFVVA
jgi:hypothetical protein